MAEEPTAGVRPRAASGGRLPDPWRARTWMTVVVAAAADDRVAAIEQVVKVGEARARQP